MVSNAGFAHAAHMKMHVRKGEAEVVHMSQSDFIIYTRLGINPVTTYRWKKGDAAQGDKKP
jgi:hypothetical protein